MSYDLDAGNPAVQQHKTESGLILYINIELKKWRVGAHVVDANCRWNYILGALNYVADCTRKSERAKIRNGIKDLLDIRAEDFR